MEQKAAGRRLDCWESNSDAASLSPSFSSADLRTHTATREWNESMQ